MNTIFVVALPTFTVFIASSTRSETSKGGLGEYLVHRDVRRYDWSDGTIVLQARYCVRLFLHISLALSTNSIVIGCTQCSELGATGSEAKDGGARRADRVQALIIPHIHRPSLSVRLSL